MKKLLLFLLLVMLAGVTGCKQEKAVSDDVEEAISSFITNYASDYLSDVEKLDYYVISAIKALDDSGYDVSLNDYLDADSVYNYYQNYEYQTINEIFKAIIVCHAFGVGYEKAKEALEEITDVDIYNYTYGLIALKITNVNKNLQDELSEKVLIIREEDYRDPDYAGLAMMATSDEDVNRDSLFTLIDDAINDDGVVSWGNANSCSTANVILGLMALDIDPTTYQDHNLIASLLKYYEDGAFKYTLDGEVDLLFSTPQAFAALAMYKVFYETDKPVNLFL